MADTIRWRMPTPAEAVRMGMTKPDGTFDDDQHRNLAAAAVARIEDPKHPLTGTPTQVAQAAGLTLAQARSRAKEKGLGHKP